jgi:hypothetical protein
MSSFSSIISCTGCSYKYYENHQSIQLQTVYDSIAITYYRETAWCYECDSVQNAEKLPNIDNISASLFNLKSAGFFSRLSSKHRSETKLAEHTVRWLKERTSPPCCLKCGSSEIAILKFKNNSDMLYAAEGFKHSCGGALVQSADDSGIRYSIAPKVLWMTLEGQVRTNTQ